MNMPIQLSNTPLLFGSGVLDSNCCALVMRTISKLYVVALDCPECSDCGTDMREVVQKTIFRFYLRNEQ